ncbi:hypothetical protein [Mycobacterium marinum]|uniref:hypothetical protein n=1 Tax=Mycobacterium marinum TaxID=1781 RepID=UPI00356897E6
MRRLVRILMVSTAITLAISAGAAFSAGTAGAIPDPGGATRVGLRAAGRHCDFSITAFAPQVPPGPTDTGSALIRTAGSTVIAEVHLVNTALPGMHYDVGLIQAPRPSSAPCGPGAPDTAFTGLDLDGSGAGTVTIQDAIRPGTTGVWVLVQRPSIFSQDPAEVYTSDFLASI